MSPDALLALVLACAPAVHPATMLKVVAVESAGAALAINVNGQGGGTRRVATLDDAVRVAEAAMASGRSVDMGLAQINSRNLGALGLSVREVFDPCTNLRAGAHILTDNYQRAGATASAPGIALTRALSAYNTGDFERGVRNGYVARYVRHPNLPRARSDAGLVRAATVAARDAPSHAYRRTTMIETTAAPVPSRVPEPRLSTDPNDAGIPGVQVIFSPEEADAMGAFEELAISEDDAWAASVSEVGVEDGGHE